LLVEVFGDLGLDFVWLDFEHTGPSAYDSKVFENLTRAAEGAGTELLVRTPSGDPEIIRKILDTGVRNLLIPRIETAEEVKRAV
jgi:2-dehydro-3-deoxyglucarate aldolase